MASQATQEMVRSSARTQGASLTATCSTFTPIRMAASATRTGMAMRNNVSGSQRASAVRAT